MIIRYNEFVNESFLFGWDNMKKYNIKNYIKNTDGSIDLIGAIKLPKSNKKHIKLPFDKKIKNIYGNFNCSNNKLTTLEGSPENIKEITLLHKDNNNFNGNTFLYGDPENSPAKFDCSNNLLTTLKGGPKVVDHFINCSYNKLTDLEGCPLVNTICCDNNNLTSLKGCPKKLVRLSCTINPLLNLDYIPRYIQTLEIDYSILKNGIEIDLSKYPVSFINKIELLLKKGGSNPPQHGKSKLIDDVLQLIDSNKDILENLLDDKIKFHQMLMRLDPLLIPYYRIIPPPSKGSRLLF